MLAVACGGLAANTRGEGFRSPTTGAAGLGATGGKIAFIDDASAVFHNPANLLELRDWEAAVEPTLVYHDVEFRRPDGARARTEDPWKILPHFFVGGPILDDRVALGLGVSVPFGLSVDWGSGGALRYVGPRYVELQTFNFNPTVAVRLARGLHVGVGLDVMYSDLSIRQKVNLGMFGAPDADMILDGDGTGVSGNIGVTWEFLPGHRFAVTLRAPMDIDYDGNLTVRDLPDALGGRVRVPFGSEIRFPTIVAVGYGVEVTERLRVEVNMEWLEFSRFDTLPVEIPAGALGPFQDLVPPEVPQRWDDTITVGVGVTYDLGGGWKVRGSYHYFETPVPEETYSPTIPDASQHAVAAGLHYRRGRHRVDLAYSRVFYDDREISRNINPAYLGDYEVEVHLISAAYGFSF